MISLLYHQRVLGFAGFGAHENSTVKRTQVVAIQEWVTSLGSFHPGNQRQNHELRVGIVDNIGGRWGRMLPNGIRAIPILYGMVGANLIEYDGSRLFLTAMAIHLCLWVAPLDLQQGGNSRIPYEHVPVAGMSILVYITTAINTFLFLLTKHPLFLRSFGTGTELGAFSTLFTLVTGGFGETYVGHLLGVGCSSNHCINLVPYLHGCTAFSKASYRTGSYFNPC
ncbi:hypothetical protein R6Q57_016111 [Mikania cordata]